MDPSDNFETEFVSGEYYRTLVEAKLRGNMLLTQLETDNDQETQRQFKSVISFLSREISPKYDRREDLDRPDILEDREKYDMTNVGVQKCRELLRDYSRLMEKLGIVSMARRQYEMKEKGAVKKE